MKYLVGTGEKIFTVYIPDTSENLFCTVQFISFSVSGTGDTSLVVYNLVTLDKLYCDFYFMIIYCFTFYNPDLSGKFYGTVDFSPFYAYYSLFYASRKKNLKYLVETG